tara:strand:- start:192 stop:347 length:156 start_codon:yes stop_codon:yes gene_type:complete
MSYEGLVRRATFILDYVDTAMAATMLIESGATPEQAFFAVKGALIMRKDLP